VAIAQLVVAVEMQMIIVTLIRVIMDSMAAITICVRGKANVRLLNPSDPRLTFLVASLPKGLVVAQLAVAQGALTTSWQD
jgi:hypothetical protein